ncbi:hypothetical protein FJTKL_07825 [Diaporthe vaccinii]|uniref:Uncharacterized protein n=1 Tax=Diaporthe vaccinii TaxID=105482 RepID=A0ABR4FDZ9_9PEZI
MFQPAEYVSPWLADILFHIFGIVTVLAVVGCAVRVLVAHFGLSSEVVRLLMRQNALLCVGNTEQPKLYKNLKSVRMSHTELPIRPKSLVVHTGVLRPSLSVGPLHDESSPLNSVDDDESRWEEGVVSPRADKLDAAAAGQCVVLWVDVEVAELGDTGTGLVGLQRGDVQHVQAGTVVALVCDSVDSGAC